MNICRRIIPLVIIAAISVPLLSSCSRYAHNVNSLYEQSVNISNGSGEIYIVIPENQRTNATNEKWAIGNVNDGSNQKIDIIISPRSSAEIIQSAFGIEFKKGGYAVIPFSKLRGGEQQVIELTKADINLDQDSGLTNLKAKCRVLVAMDVYKQGKLSKRLQYESSSSNVDIKDRDLLANKVLLDALQSVMLKAVPDLDSLFKSKEIPN